MSDEIRIVAVAVTVELQSEAEKREQVAALRQWMDPDALEHAAADIDDPSRYTVYARLAARLSDGRQVSTGVRDFSWTAPRDGLGAIHHRYRGPRLSNDPREEVRLLPETYHVGLSDVQDAINEMLGRDPEQHRPPWLPWKNLLNALSAEGVQVTEEDLVAAPLKLDLSDEVKTEIGAG